MNTSLSKQDLKEYISVQLNNFFPDKYNFDGSDVDASLNLALERTEYCFKHISLDHYTHDKQVWFNHLHSDQYATFLYFLANSLWRQSQNKNLCDKLILLNKVLNSLFISYKCNLPDIFCLSHPIGTVIGNAIYSDFLVILQNVTVNTSPSEQKPTKLGKGILLSAGVCVVGESVIGDFTSIGASTLVYNMDVPNNSIVFTDSRGNVKIKPNEKECFAQRVFNVKIN